MDFLTWRCEHYKAAYDAKNKAEQERILSIARDLGDWVYYEVLYAGCQ